MANRDLVAIGTSAGGVEALVLLTRALPPVFPAAVLVTIHLSDQFPSSMDEVLNRMSPLQAAFARAGEKIRKGRIYIAPPGRHLIVDGDTCALGHGPRENNTRPAVDPMMRSIALCCGPRAIGVVLTGTLGDGASGLWAIGHCGGISVVQDPRDAEFPQMPTNAITQARPDHVVSLSELPRLLTALVDQPAGPAMPVPRRLKYEVEVAKNGHSNMTEMDKIGRRSTLTCPDCAGVLWEIEEEDLVRYRCHQGHAYTSDVMSVALDESVRHALGSGLRALEERVALLERMAKQARERGNVRVAANWADKAREFEREAEIIRKAIRRVDDIAEKAEAEQSAA